MEPEPDNNYGRDGFSWASNLGFWFRAPIVNGKYQNWECVNFFDDESANALLLDSMHSKETLDVRYVTNIQAGGISWTIIEIKWLDIAVRHKNRKDAVVLATCKWLGIEVKEIEE
jgi:hypothetical protein